MWHLKCSTFFFLKTGYKTTVLLLLIRFCGCLAVDQITVGVANGKGQTFKTWKYNIIWWYTEENSSLCSRSQKVKMTAVTFGLRSHQATCGSGSSDMIR